MALSFVQTRGDLRQAREALRQAGAPDLPLVAKLERPEAVARTRGDPRGQSTR